MFFKIPSSSRQFQLKPTKLLAYSLCLLGLFSVVALIVQLRAIELRPQPPPRHHQVDYRQRRPNNLTKIYHALQERPTLVPPALSFKADETSIREQVVASIDRDDRATSYDDQPSEWVATQRAEPPAGLGQTQEPLEERQGHRNDLVVAPTNEQLLSAKDLTASLGTHSAQASHNKQEAQIQEPHQSLAELTAAGTAAGLLVHDDLVAQANMLNQQFPNSHEELAQQSGNEYDSSDVNLDQNLAQLMPEQVQKMMTTRQQQQQQAQEDEENFGEETDGSPGSTRRPMPMPLQAHQTAQRVASSPDAPELPNENQLPDSIESLMGVESPIDADDRDSSATTGPQQLAQGQQTNLDGGDDDGELQQQQLAGSNLVNQNQLLPLGGFISPQLASLLSDRGQEQENYGDEDEADERLESAGDVDQQALVSNVQLPLVPLNSADSRQISSLGSEQNLVAPMRDSLMDLNTAADHYYGKKKKKMKYKKIKIVKIKKKKKKVKKVKKHNKKQHDHGKYYMYAKVPKKKSWESGFKKGNKKHWIERHEKGHKNKFKTKVKWYDKKSKGKGLHIWDYNHHDKEKKHYG